MRVVCLSDTHSQHASLSVPGGDVLIHAGDMTKDGTAEEAYAAFRWLSELPHDRVIAIPGNHDGLFQHEPKLRRELRQKYPRVELLIGEETLVHGVRLYGSPWQPWASNMAYNFPPGRQDERVALETWSQIPGDTAILVTHGPPYGILDRSEGGVYSGCTALKGRLLQLPNLALHVFGHIHEGYGCQRVGQVLEVNACICDSQDRPTRVPFVIDFDAASSDAKLATS